MIVTKKTSSIIFIMAIFLLSISLLFKGNITGHAVFSESVFDYSVFSYLIIALVGIVIISGFSIYARGMIKPDIQGELSEFNIDDTNTSADDLERYIDYCISQGRDEIEIKDILSETKLDKNLINDAIKHMKGKS